MRTSVDAGRPRDPDKADLRPGGLGLDALALEEEHALRLDGQDIRSAYESADEFAARVAHYGDATDVFRSQTELAASESDYALGFAVDLCRFPSEDAAAAWLRAAPAILEQDPDVTDFAIADEIANVGEEAVAMTSARDSDHDGVEVTYERAE